MFERQERTALLILAGVAMVVIGGHLAIGTLGKQSFARSYANTSADYELVHIEGRIDQMVLTKTGGHVILSINDVAIFIPSQVAQGLSMREGENISVYGVVETYRGKKEIVVSSAEDIHPIPDT